MKSENSIQTQGKQNYISGKKFELFIYNIFYDLNKNALRKNVFLKKNSFRSEFDIVFGILRKTYIECKYKSRSYYVTDKEVSIFAKKLDLHKIANSKGIMITNTGLTNKAQAICNQSKIRFIERKELEKLDYERLGLFKSLIHTLIPQYKTLESKINNMEL